MVRRGVTTGHHYDSSVDRNSDLYTGVRVLGLNLREPQQLKTQGFFLGLVVQRFGDNLRYMFFAVSGWVAS